MPIKTQNLYKLITNEDSKLIHKSLGIMCLINFIYQFYHLFIYGHMKLENNHLTPYIFILHGTLSLSSFIFHVPKNRHKGLPMIYQEFRLHSILFALRSVLCGLCFYYKLDLLFNILIINLTMILADIVSSKYKADTKTMRGMPFNDNINEIEKKGVTLMHTNQQFAATMFMLSNIDGAFSPLFAIQIAAFLMTLVRKGIISTLDWHRVYSLSLWINIFVYWSFDNYNIPIYIILGSTLFSYARINYGHNKYLVWNSIFTLLYYFNSYNIIDVSNYILFKYIVNFIIITYLFRQLNYSIALWC
jgi:hypothetical protein